MKTTPLAAGLSALAVSFLLASCGDGSTAKIADNYTPPATFTETVDTADIDSSDIREPGRVTADSSVQDRKIYRDSESYTYLESSSYIEPGMKYFVDTAEGLAQCSFGWTVEFKNDPGTFYNLTAGHCGEVGDKVYMDFEGTGDPSHYIHVGTFAWQLYEETTMDEDYSLIQFLEGAEKYMTGTPNLLVGGDREELNLLGWEDAGWLEKTKPYMCRLGFRSGLSCGNYQEMVDDNEVAFDNIVDHGDSGGVIWAFDPDDSSGRGIRAVAITSWGTRDDATTAVGQTIDKVMEEFAESGNPLVIRA